LPGKYSEPEGQILFAKDGDKFAGIVAMRPLEDAGAAEMKRLYVREDWRGQGLGRELVARIIGCARAQGYVALRLDTVPQLEAAIALYLDLGFKEIGDYSDGTSIYLGAELRYFELDLT
jgi:GNAT superfamily N-acetyltransferase